MAFRLFNTLKLILIGSLLLFGWAISSYAFTVLQGEYWHQIIPTQSPPGLVFHALAYDPDRQVTVLFGGNNGSARVNKTWEYDGTTWMDVSPLTSPPGRENITHAMVYDKDRDKMVLFGGNAAAIGYVNDTWEFNGTSWNQVNPATKPSARDAHTLVYDSIRNKTVLFGGFSLGTNYLNDTWVYNGSNWQQVFPAQSPPGRHHHGAAYDSQRGVMVVFGGIGQGGVYLNDTWEFDGTNWKQVFPPFMPTARSNQSMTYDYQRRVVVLFGGTEDGSNKLNDTWEYDGSNWRLVVPTTSPEARIGAPLAYDSNRQLVVMYGGGYFQGNLQVLNDTWEYQGGPAINLHIVDEARLDVGMPYDTDRGCSTPYTPCGGAFHGFHAGVGADLVMDAYRTGASFDIQAELILDQAANPGRYRFGTARHVEDMRRYFFNNQLWQDHAQPYLPGDVVFFDWDPVDNIADHAGIVSEIDATARPLKIVSATGYHAGNISGRASELDWNTNFETHTVGHARLDMAGSSAVTNTGSVQALRVRVDSPSINLKLMDVNGRVTGEAYDENLVASNVKDHLPYIPGGEYSDLGTQQVITVTNPLLNADKYHIELTAQITQTYHLHLETLENNGITDYRVYTATLDMDKSQRLDLVLRSTPNFSIKTSSGAPLSSPQLNIPAPLYLSGIVGTTVQQVFNLQEMGGFYPVNSLTITATNLYNQLGATIPANKISITPNSLSIPTGGSEAVTLQVNLDGAPLGMYQGSLKLIAANCNPRRIPVTVMVQPRQLFLPLVTR